ncbi:class I glutamine amidotransferase-like protein [Aspergillus oleicola]
MGWLAGYPFLPSCIHTYKYYTMSQQDPTHHSKNPQFNPRIYLLSHQTNKTHSNNNPTKMPARKALIAVTSASARLFNGSETTGLFIIEALHPYLALTAAGFDVTLASETGAYTPDWLSLQPEFLSGEDLAIWRDEGSEFRRKLDNMPKASDLLKSRDSGGDGVKCESEYGIFFASAGHAALLDYPSASSLQKIAENVWASGGVVASVCHGPAVFANVVDKSTGKALIKGKRLTGFTTEAEDTMSIMADLRGWKAELVEELAGRLGARYERSPGIWDDFHVVDGRLVTGQNPASSTSTARAAIEVFDKLG